MFVGATCYFVHGPAADFFLLEWLMPQRRVHRAVARKGRVDWHRVADLVRQAVDDVIIAFMHIELCSGLAFFSVPKLMQRRQFTETIRAPLSIQSPRQHRHVAVIASQPVAPEAPLPVVKCANHLQIAKS